MLENDRKIKISAASSRRASTWPAREMWLSEFYAKLKIPARGTENLSEYLSMKKSQQDDLKDVGGFVGGTLDGNKRRAGSVLGRDLITLDMDHIAAGETDTMLKRVGGIGCGYAVYSTRKHAPSAPRLRVIIPTDRTMSPDEYEPVARKLAELIDREMRVFDRTTFESGRLMYWPSCCADSEFVYDFADKPLISVDGMLNEYSDWRDVTSWPQCPDAPQRQKAAADKQEDPTTKKGIIGAFCRVYNVFDAMERFIPDAYTQVDGMPDRYTYTGGSTTGGAIVYGAGKWLFSHHATDPASGQLCNAFDLVRLHKFGSLDDEAKPGTPSAKLPSYVEMCHLANSDQRVSALVLKERQDYAAEVFGDAPATDPTDDASEWHLKTSSNGGYEKTVDNIYLIIENDKRLRGKIYRDVFADKNHVTGVLPWNQHDGDRLWTDNDDSGLRWYVERQYGISGKDKVFDALNISLEKHTHDPVREYLDVLIWDGMPRLDTLLIDYLGAADTRYTRTVTRKAFVAAVARTYQPGCKYDSMLILTGEQGIGKSTLLHTMARDWFLDGINTFEGKEAKELIQGYWLVEIGELEAMDKSETGRVKLFLSQQEDIYRAAYGRRTAHHPRRCVFFGTTNEQEFLRDRTGNRRFWPVDCGVTGKHKNIIDELTPEVDQIWAEAATRYRTGESLYLRSNADNEAAKAA